MHALLAIIRTYPRHYGEFCRSFIAVTANSYAHVAHDFCPAGYGVKPYDTCIARRFDAPSRLLPCGKGGMVYTTAEKVRRGVGPIRKRMLVFCQPFGLSGPAVVQEHPAGHTRAGLSQILSTVVSNCRVLTWAYLSNQSDSLCELHCEDRLAFSWAHTISRRVVVVPELPQSDTYAKPGFYSPAGHFFDVSFLTATRLPAMPEALLCAMCHAPVLIP